MIIGSGVAALSVALNLPKSLEVLLITKDSKKGSNSYWAQGGVAVALDKKDVESHVDDTIKAGALRNNKDAVEILSNQSREIIDSLIKLGMDFDKDQHGVLHYTKEGAHSANRILHAGGDATGKELNTFLFNQNPHTIKYGTVVDLLIEDDICYGVTFFDGEETDNIYANNVVIASGGMGSLFQNTTNAKGISADLHGIAIEKNIEMRDMHMLQFHPTVLKDDNPQKFLLTEALRGEGAKLINSEDEYFMSKYDEREELAPRDVVSRSIFQEEQKGKEVFLDLRSFDYKFFQNRFPTISKKLEEININIKKDLIPISPAFHYAMGGIKTDLEGRVSNYKNLYAVGEAASTMVHGANRLASNSLLEGLVFGKIVSNTIKASSFHIKHKSFAKVGAPKKKSNDTNMRNTIRSMMWEKVGIIRDQKNLNDALISVEGWLKEDVGHFIRLKLLVAKEIIKEAISHTESQGAHYINKDN
ncbi:MAG: L-aspartate oxidase [Campylobacterales bacterium]|nr:L-aspartate oxidase [Campylobacterales bacterium]